MLREKHGAWVLLCLLEVSPMTQTESKPPVKEPGPQHPPEKEPPNDPPPHKDPPVDDSPMQASAEGKLTTYAGGVAMTTLLVAVVLIGMILTGLYAFGTFSTPYTEAFRFGFYLLIALALVAVVLVVGRQPFEGYDPTPNSP